MSLNENDTLTDALTKKDVLKWLQFIDINWGDGGLLKAYTSLDNLMEGVKVTQFEELRVPLNVVAADFWRRDQVVFESGDLVPSLSESIFNSFSIIPH